MNYEKPIEYSSENQESKRFVEKLKESFSLFDTHPQLPVIEEDKLINSDAKACFHYDEEKNGEKIKMINKNYLIFVEKIKNIENKENLPTSIAIHEIRHRAQREDEYERQKGAEQLELFSIDFIKNINNEYIKNALLDYANGLPEQVKNNPLELDAKVTEKIICNLIEDDLIGPEEIKKLLKSNSHQILKHLLLAKKQNLS